MLLAIICSADFQSLPYLLPTTTPPLSKNFSAISQKAPPDVLLILTLSFLLQAEYTSGCLSFSFISFSDGHFFLHNPQCIHNLPSTFGYQNPCSSVSKEIAPFGHISAHILHPVHSSFFKQSIIIFSSFDLLSILHNLSFKLTYML